MNDKIGLPGQSGIFHTLLEENKRLRAENESLRSEIEEFREVNAKLATYALKLSLKE